MSASPEFYKPAPVFSQCSSPLLLHGGAAGASGGGGDNKETAEASAWEDYCCRTPTGPATHLKEAPGTCPPAPKKPRAPPAPCRKRLFEVEVFSLRLEELERLFWRPHTPPPEKKRRKLGGVARTPRAS